MLYLRERRKEKGRSDESQDKKASSAVCEKLASYDDFDLVVR